MKQRREEMYEKVTTRVEARLDSFINDIKFMQVGVWSCVVLRESISVCVCVCVHVFD
jgi:hypothetical protein